MIRTRFLFVVTLWLVATAGWAHPQPQVVRADDVESVPFPGHALKVLARAADTPGGASIQELIVPPRSFGAPPHVHSREDEHFYVLEGEVQFLDREQTLSARAGTLVVLPRGHLHGFWNASDAPARLLLVITPGDFTEFFDAVVARIRAENPESPGAVGKLIGQEATKHGVTIHPDKVPASAKAFLPGAK
ncbi:MAG: cupin domain-containing protein [Panacagrimonas sp.]